MVADYHIHTSFSGDCDTQPRAILNKALELGMSELCFTDHIDYDYPPDDAGVNIFTFDPKAYFSAMNALKQEYSGRIKVKIGVEMGVNRECDRANRELLDAYPFDFVIGSSHIVDGMDPYYSQYWENGSIYDCILRYYEAVLRNVTYFDNYNVYGHLDYIRRYIPDRDYVYKDTTFSDITDMILKNIIAKGRGIELNTRGLSKGLTTFVPTISLLNRYRELGGEIITVGSDSHDVKKLGFAFKTARDILLNTGFKYVASFENKIATFIPL